MNSPYFEYLRLTIKEGNVRARRPRDRLRRKQRGNAAAIPPASLIQLLDHRHFGEPQRMRHLGFAQARRVIFEGQFRPAVVELELAQTVGVCELAQAAQLLGVKRRLQGITDFEKCHAAEYSRPVQAPANREGAGLTRDRGERYKYP